MADLKGKEDRDFAVELLSGGTLTPDQELQLMDSIDRFDAGAVEAELTQEEQAKQQKWQLTQDRIDRTPTQPRERQPDTRGSPLGFSAAQFQGTEIAPDQRNPDRQVLIENAAALGVDTKTGLDGRTRAAAGLLAFDGNAQIAAVDSMLRKDLNGVPGDFPVVFNDESTGELMFLRQTEDGTLKPTLINPPGLEGGDILEFAGEVPTIALETIGSIGGAVIGSAASPGAGTVIGGVAGAGVLGGLSIPAREMFAKALGVPQEIIDDIDTSDEVLWASAIAAGGELAAFGVLGTISGARNFFGRPLDIDDLPSLEAKIAENLKKVKELEERTGAKFNPSIGELSGDADLLVAEANLKRDAIGRAAADMRAAEIQSDKAGAEALDAMATRKVRGPADEGFRSVEDVSEATRQALVEDPTNALTQTRVDAEDALTDAQTMAQREADLDQLTLLRGDVFKQAEKYVEVEAKAWTNYRKVAGWDPQARQSGALLDNQGDTPIRQVMQRLQADGNESLLASLANAHRSTLMNAGFNPQQIDTMVDPADLTGLAQQALDPFHLHMALSHLKREQRAIVGGANPNGWEAADLGDVIGALETQMSSGNFLSRATGKPLSLNRGFRIRDAWNHANDTTQELHTVFDTRNMQSLMETRLVRTGERTVIEMPNMPAGLIRKRLMAPGDARMLQETMDVIGHEPNAKAAMINELRKNYTDTVIKDGRFQQGLHNKWMDDFTDHRNVLGMEDNIDNIAGFGRVADEAIRNAERIGDTLSTLYGRNVADGTKPLSIAQEVLSNRVKPQQAKNLMRDLNRLDPDLGGAVEEKIVEEIFQSLTANKAKVVNAATLQQMLRSNRDTLTAVFGGRYTKDLDLLHDVLKTMGERDFAVTSKVSLQSGWTSLTRSLFGPLSKKQRFLTSLQRVARNSRAGRVSDILEQPESLRQFVKLKNLSIHDPRYWTTVQGLGLVDIAIEDDPAKAAFQRFSSGEMQESLRDVRFRQGDQF